MKSEGNDLIWQNKVFLWMALATGLLLLVPLIAMQFTNQVNWASGDFGVMGLLLFGMGSLFVLAARKVNRKYWVGIGFALAVAFLYVWAEMAVGIFTNWGG